MAPVGIPITKATLSELVARFAGTAKPSDLSIVRLASLRDGPIADASALTVLTRRRYRPAAAQNGALIIATPAHADSIPEERRWEHPQPMRVIAELLREAPPPRWSGGIAATARIHETAEIAPGATIGERSVIAAFAVVEAGVRIGADCVIGAHTVLGRAGFGWETDGERPVRVPHLAGVVLGDRVELGSHCSVDAGMLAPTRIDQDAKLDAHVHVGHNAVVGEGTLIAAQAGLAGSCVLGRGCLVGGQAGIADHIHVGDGARIAAKSGVIKDVPPGSTVAGYPARPGLGWLRR